MHLTYAADIQKRLKTANIRAELDDSDETLGKKIRNAKLEKIPYLLVVGEKEVASATATLESRDRGQVGVLPIEEIITALQQEIAEKRSN